MSPQYPALFLQVFSLLAALVHLVLGGFVFLEDARNSANRLLAFLYLTFFFWAATYGLQVGAGDLFGATFWNQVGTVAWALAPALLLHFVLAFTWRGSFRLPRWAGLALYLPSLVVASAAVQGPVVASSIVRTPLGWAEVQDPSRPMLWFYIAYYGSFCLYGLVRLRRWGNQATFERDRRCARLMFLSGATTVAAASLLTFAQPAVTAQPMPGLAHFALLINAGGFFWALRHYRLLELTPEHAAQGILAGMREAVLLLNERSRVLYANPSAQRLLGTDAEPLIGTSLPSLGAGSLDDVLGQVLSGKRSSSGLPFEQTLVFQDGQERHAVLRALTMRDQFGQLYGVALLVDDVTEQRQLRRRLEEADRLALQERLAAVGMLAVSVAHEINNPLGYVSTNLELARGVVERLEHLCDGKVPSEQLDELRRELGDAQDGSRRVAAIVRELEGFTRVERVSMEAPVRLDAVLRSVLSLANNELRHRARVEVELPELPLVVANEGRLAQVFLNLLINAAHAIPAGAVEDNLVTVRGWLEPESIVVEIRDTGGGIAPADLPHIFEPFHSSKARGQGMGLGLAISRKIVEEMGGRIEAESRQGEGSRFVVLLPRTLQVAIDGAQPEAASPSEPREHASSVPVEDPAPQQRRRILLVDDEPLLLRALARTLQPHFEVTTAPSGWAAKALIEDGTQVDMIVTDLMMAEGSGMDLFAWVAERDPSLAQRTIFLTGGAFESSAGDFVDRHHDRVMRKPIQRSELLAAVERLLG